MKQIILTAVCFLAFTIYGKSQHNNITSNTIKVLLETEKLRVVEYASTPGKDVCGKGMHTHVPHLSICMTDAIVRLTTTNGKVQDLDLKAGTTFWSEADTHMVVNNGNKPAKVYLIELK